VCVATENGFIFWGGGVVLVGSCGFFGKILGCVLWVLWVGVVGGCCCFALFCGAYPLLVTRTPYPYFLTLNYPF